MFKYVLLIENAYGLEVHAVYTSGRERSFESYDKGNRDLPNWVKLEELECYKTRDEEYYIATWWKPKKG